VTGRLVFHVFAALAEFIRELIVDGTNEGLAAARGQRLGRPPAMNAEQIRQARAMLARPDESVSSIARLLGVSRSTLYKHVPELGERGQKVGLDVQIGCGDPVDRGTVRFFHDEGRGLEH
jgi:DNA invertase Pin-like site-specific DNA recombinase